MSRRSHSSGFRLHDSRVLMLVSRLLELGARTKTVEKLTGVGDLPIRDVYRELFKRSPTRGPSGYSHAFYTSAPVTQLDASLAAAFLEAHLQRHAPGASLCSKDPERRLRPGLALGELYCNAYADYHAVASHAPMLKGGLSFERFVYLGLTLAKGAVLQMRQCRRCSSVYVCDAAPEPSTANTCPACVINSRRNCKCGTYVRLDHGEIPPRRSPACIPCAKAHNRRSTLRAYDQAQAEMAVAA